MNLTVCHSVWGIVSIGARYLSQDLLHSKSTKLTSLNGTTMASFRLWRYCFVWVHYAVVASATPYLILYNAAAKCFQVDVPRQTALEIEYHAPGTSFSSL